jgi:hypothetical protein
MTAIKHTTPEAATAPQAPAPAAWTEPQAGGRYVRDPATGALQPKAAAPAPQPEPTDTPEE